MAHISPEAPETQRGERPPGEGSPRIPRGKRGAKAEGAVSEAGAGAGSGADAHQLHAQAVLLPGVVALNLLLDLL